MIISKDQIADIAMGGAFLATGGGGDVLVGKMTTEEILRRHGDVELMPLEALDDAATVIAIGSVGAPTIMQEKVSNGMEALWALQALEAYLGRKADALIAFEAGGLNALVPFLVGAQRKLPVLDADGMGRALPELQMETFSIYGVKATPLSMAGDLGDNAVINTRNSAVAEKLVRQFAIHAGGGHCCSAEHVMDGKTAKRVSVPGTISLCHRIGASLGTHYGKLDLFLADLQTILKDTHYGKMKCLFEGKIADVARRVEGGFDMGDLRLESFGADKKEMRIAIQNEYLIAKLDGEVVATVPDLIILIDHETCRPITSETIHYGHRVAVIGIGAPPIMTTPEAMKVLAPRCFGFDTDYKPL